MLKFKGFLSILGTYCTISIAVDTNLVPVFVVDNGLLDGVARIQSNPLHITSVEEFDAILTVAERRSDCLIFFIEKDFAYEDISAKDANGSPFSYLKKAFLDKRVKFLPRVVHPYNNLKERYQPFEFNSFHVRQTTTALKLEDDDYKFMYIFFEDDGANETKAEKYRRHDAIIQQVIKAVRQMSKGPVIAFYTGKRNQLEGLFGEESDRHRHYLNLGEGDTSTTSDGDHSTTPPPQVVTHASCGHASFDFFDIIRRGADKLAYWKILKCEYQDLGQEGWAYTITVEDLDHEIEDHSPLYELIFYFNFIHTNDPFSGWTLNKLVFRSEDKEIHKEQWPEKFGDFDKYYEHNTPIVLELDPHSLTSPVFEMQGFRILQRSGAIFDHEVRQYGPAENVTTVTEYPLENKPVETPRYRAERPRYREGQGPGYGEVKKPGYTKENRPEYGEAKGLGYGERKEPGFEPRYDEKKGLGYVPLHQKQKGLAYLTSGSPRSGHENVSESTSRRADMPGARRQGGIDSGFESVLGNNLHKKDKSEEKVPDAIKPGKPKKEPAENAQEGKPGKTDQRKTNKDSSQRRNEPSYQGDNGSKENNQENDVERPERFVNIVVVSCMSIVIVLVISLLLSVEMMMNVMPNTKLDKAEQPRLLNPDKPE